jgi:alpha-tubulin suppressor-like RCC1 family protein
VRASAAAILVTLGALASGCQYVFGVDFLDDPRLAADKTPPANGVKPGSCLATGNCLKPGNQDPRPCAPGEPDCTTGPDGAVVRGPAGTTHLTSFASGAQHVCTIVEGGEVKCFGANASGELGNDAIASSTTGMKVVGLSNVRTLAAGSFHTCAVLESGSVKCWGSNDFGQLGDGTLETRLVPVDVPLPTNVVAVAAGSTHTCALLGGGSVKCWGANDEGQLGNNSKTASRVPVDVPIVATSISSGVSAQHTCASTATGVKCWGANRFGQLGVGTTESSLAPQDVPGIGPGVIAAGVSHTCALTIDGIFCWGDNRLGELGSDKGDLVSSPVLVEGAGAGSGATQLGCGSHHCCTALPTQVMCWGYNDAGQLGDGSTKPSHVPVKVGAELTAIDSVAGGESYSCARSGRRVKCWGLDLWTTDQNAGSAPVDGFVDIGGL